MSLELQKIIGLLQAYRALLRDTYKIHRIGVFGSVAAGRQSKTSDIDILVEFSRPIGLLKFLELEYFLSTLLKRRVDLVTPKALKKAIKDDVLKETIYA